MGALPLAPPKRLLKKSLWKPQNFKIKKPPEYSENSVNEQTVFGGFFILKSIEVFRESFGKSVSDGVWEENPMLICMLNKSRIARCFTWFLPTWVQRVFRWLFQRHRRFPFPRIYLNPPCFLQFFLR